MEFSDLSFLTSPTGQELLRTLRTGSHPSPTRHTANPVQLISQIRAKGFSSEEAAAALSQHLLRRRAVQKFGTASDQLLFTEAGLEQATRSLVAQRHALRFSQAGLSHIADLGCGIGSNSLAFREAGLSVTAVEYDPVTAAIAQHNLSMIPSSHTGTQRVIASDATTLDFSSDTFTSVDGVFLDPARRNSGHQRGTRLTNPDEYSPSLTFAFSFLSRFPTGIKLGPGLDRELIPDQVEAQWVSVKGDVVEMGLWSGPLARAGVLRSAAVWDGERWSELAGPSDSEDAPTAPLAQFLYEPDGAVIRARQIGLLAAQLDAGMIDPSIAYLSSETAVSTPFASCFRVHEVLPLHERTLRQELNRRGIGSCEIKKRGVDIDPAQFRKKLHLKGAQHASLILTRVAGKRVAILCERMARTSH